MAELILRTKTLAPDPAYQDGDIISAYNDRRIHRIHSEHICTTWNLDKPSKQWFNRGLAEMFLAKIYQYKTERISKNAIRVTDQWTLESIIKSDIPNEYGHIFHADQFFRKRLASSPHLTFGLPGAEVLYHGKSRYLDDEDTYIWHEIETNTNYRKADYGKLLLGDEARQVHLCLTVDDFDDTERENLVSPVYDNKVDPPVMLQRRKYRVDWQGLSGMTQNTIDDVLDYPVHVRDEMVDDQLIAVFEGGTMVDIRNDFTFIRSQIVEEKAAIVEL